MSRKPIFILGTGLSHDGSSALMRDGQIIVAIEKERLTGKKHDGFNDNATIHYCLEAAGIRLADVDLIVEENTLNPKLKPEDAELRAGRLIPESAPVVQISHHLAHAYSAIGTSPFNEAGVVVMDGQGCSLDDCRDAPEEALPKELRTLVEDQQYLYWEKESYYSYRDGRMRPIFRDFSRFLLWDRKQFPAAPYDMEHSIAEFYGGISAYVFGKPFCEGKLMGLASYGQPGQFSSRAFEFDGPRVFLRKEWMEGLPSAKAGKFVGHGDAFRFYANLAYWAQQEIEEAILYVFRSYYELSPHRNVAYAGGLALNAVANSRVVREGPFQNFYVQPAAGDNGLAIGCCYYGWCEILGREKVCHGGRTWFGKKYNSATVWEALVARRDEVEFERCDDYVSRTAELLAQGHIIAWFQDESEFGPRALGNRSILANPTLATVRDHINRNVKFREDFRPFAPVVLNAEVGRYFDLAGDGRYMTLVADTHREWWERLPAVVHVDGTARVQTITKELRPQLYELLLAVKKHTGIGMLLNTSLNTKGKPIVERPEQAIECLVETALDVLVIEDYIVKKRQR